MGNILGKIDDDERQYESLCEKYGEKPDEVYSEHYQWIMNRHKADVPDDFDSYRIPVRVENTKAKIKILEKEIQDLNFKLAQHRAELLRLEKGML